MPGSWSQREREREREPKKFLIIGNKNAITYKKIFPYIKNDEIWLGYGFAKGTAFFAIPKENATDYATGVYNKDTGLVKFGNCCWFTNLEHGRRHRPIPLMTMADVLKYSNKKELRGKSAFDKYDNYDAIEVPYVDSIPSDYDGVMGVPITFLDKYSPEQFEILGNEDSLNIEKGRGYVNGQRKYGRIFIRHRRNKQ